VAALFCASICTLRAQAEAGSSAPEVGSTAISASEARIHDLAFSLLLETYRQFQNNLIQSDYSNRLSAAATLTDSTTRKEVIALARQERDLRLRRLTAQLVAFSTAYDHSPQYDERGVGVTSRVGVGMRAAARKLQGFVVIAPATDGSQDAQAMRTLPSSAVLLNRCPTP